MVPDKIINMTISNIESYLIYKNSFYAVTYDIIILSANSNEPCAYFIICKFNSEETYIHTKTCNNYDVNILLEINQTPKIFINNNFNSHNVVIKINEY